MEIDLDYWGTEEAFHEWNRKWGWTLPNCGLKVTRALIDDGGDYGTSEIERISRAQEAENLRRVRELDAKLDAIWKKDVSDTV